MRYSGKGNSAPKGKTMPAKKRRKAPPSKGKTAYRQAFTRGRSY